MTDSTSSTSTPLVPTAFEALVASYDSESPPRKAHGPRDQKPVWAPRALALPATSSQKPATADRVVTTPSSEARQRADYGRFLESIGALVEQVGTGKVEQRAAFEKLANHVNAERRRVRLERTRAQLDTWGLAPGRSYTLEAVPVGRYWDASLQLFCHSQGGSGERHQLTFTSSGKSKAVAIEKLLDLAATQAADWAERLEHPGQVTPRAIATVGSPSGLPASSSSHRGRQPPQRKQPAIDMGPPGSWSLSIPLFLDPSPNPRRNRRARGGTPNEQESVITQLQALGVKVATRQDGDSTLSTSTTPTLEVRSDKGHRSPIVEDEID